MIKIGDNYFAQTENIIESKGLLWFTERLTGDLLYFNPKTCESKLVWESNCYGNRLFGSIAIWENDIILIPFNYDHIVIYNIEKKQFKKKKIYKSTYNDLIGWGCVASGLCSHVIGSSVYITPSLYPGIIEYNLRTEEIRIHTIQEWKDKEVSVSLNGERAFFRCSYNSNEKIYMPSCKNNYIYVFDAYKKEFTLIEVGNNKLRFSSAVKIDNYLWMAPRNGKLVVKMQLDNRHIEEKYIEGSEDYNCSNIVLYDGLIRLLPNEGKEAFYDSSSGTFRIVSDMKENCVPLKGSMEGIFRNNSAEITFKDTDKEEHTSKIKLPLDMVEKYLHKEKSIFFKTKMEGKIIEIIEENDNDGLKELISYLI